MLDDLRHAARRLVRQPRFTLAALLTLALAIGANTAIWSVVEAVLLRPVPFSDAERLFRVLEQQKGPEATPYETAYADLLDWKAASETLDGLAGWASSAGVLVVDFDGAGPRDPESIGGRIVTGDFFTTLGIAPVRGRLLELGDDDPGAEPVVVIGERLWRSRLGGDPSTIGSRITVSSREHVVVGVAPSDLDYPLGSKIWVPLGPSVDASLRENRNVGFLTMVARVRDGRTAVQAQQELDGLIERISNPQRPAGRQSLSRFEPLVETLAADARSPLALLVGAAGLLLLLGCANVAVLQLARSLLLQPELALRSALGAGARRLVWVATSESVLLAALGGGLGVLLARFALRSVLDLDSLALFRGESIGVHRPALFVAFACCLVAMLIGGLFPALVSMPAWLSGAIVQLGGGARGSSGTSSQRRSFSVLVALQIAIATLLLVGAGVLTSSFLRLQAIDPGFDAARVVTASVPLLPLDDEEQQLELPQDQAARAAHDLFDRIVEEASSVPGVEAAAGVLIRPLHGSEGLDYPFFIEGREDEAPGNPFLNYEAVTLDYFAVLGVPLLAGRWFEDSDHAQAPPVVLVSETTARRLWPYESPVGQRIHWGAPGSPTPAVTVVGVVGDVRSRDWKRAGFDVYVPHRQSPWRLYHLVLRTELGPRVVAGVQEAIRRIDPRLSLLDVASGETLVDAWLARSRFLTRLVGAFALLALTLAAPGLYSGVALSVATRSRELSLRAALGARPSDLAQLVLTRAALLTASGIGGGLLLALATAKLAASQFAEVLYETSRRDMTNLVLALGVLLLVSLLASYLPARRASRSDPGRLLIR
jgi:putative ABC transport system permease protein